MNQANIENNKFITASLLILALVAVAFSLNFTKPIMIPFVLALLIRILIDPIIDFQTDKLHVHRIIAVLVSIVLIVFLFMIFVPFIIGSVATFLQSADDYNIKVLLLIDFIINKLQEYEIDVDREIIRNTLTTLPFLDWASKILSNSANFISKFFLVAILTLFLLLGNVFSHIPLLGDIGARVNIISPLASAFSVMFLYLIIVQLLETLNNDRDQFSNLIINNVSALIAALTFAITDSHWFNAVEAEVYSISTFFTTIVVWLILKWSKNHNNPGNYRYILMIAYMLGLATGIHLLNLLALPFIALIIYFKNYKLSIEGIIGTILATALSFFIIYLGIIKGIPNLANTYGWQTPLAMIILIIAITIITIYYRNYLFATILTSIILVLIGFSTYSTIFIRASQEPRINENSPNTLEEALSYMNRDQYGDWEILNFESTLARPENTNWRRYTLDRNNPTFNEKMNFFFKYQINEMYLRYFGWQFIGRGDKEEYPWYIQDIKGNLIGNQKLDGVNLFRYGLPLAFILGILGLFAHFKHDWKRALAVLSLFLATGFLIILYLNQYDPQPRERDYSFVGSFFAFSIWIGIGLSSFQYKIRKFIENNNISLFVLSSFITISFIFMPIKMLATDYFEHNRSDNFTAWDYGYNLLNSCEPNGIIFTNGDNDTFPLWYLQEVENIRKDVNVVNLSLLNTPWYIDQLKNQEPKININLKDEYIEKLDPINGTAFALDQWTNLWGELKNRLNNYFKEKLQQTYNVSEHGIPVEWSPIEADLTLYEKNITLNLNATISNYLKVQDIMILKILDDLENERPIYFAVTVAPSNRVGLEKYLQMEGLVYKVTNKKTHNWDPNYPSPRINFSKMEKFKLETSISRNYYNHNILAFGECLHKIHPLAGQGFNMIIRDIKILSNIIQNRIDLGFPIDFSICKEFENKTKHYNFTFSFGNDFIYEFFKFDNNYKNNYLNYLLKFFSKNEIFNKFAHRYANRGLFIE